MSDLLRIKNKGTDAFDTGFKAGIKAGADDVWGDPEIIEIFSTAAKTPEARRDARRKIAAIMGRLKTKLAGADFDIEKARQQAGMLGELVEWAEAPASMQNCTESHLHDLRAALRNGRILGETEDSKPARIYWAVAIKEAPQTFLVQKDWAAAIGTGSEIEGAQFRLPYDQCCFEFRISKRSVLVLARQEGEEILLTQFIQIRGHWANLQESRIGGNGKTSSVLQLTTKQIRAACIALDAEVVVSEVVRASSSENRGRLKQGLPPRLSHRVLSLARRNRVPALDGAGTHRSPRLHFRRGHWRHFPNHKTWIKWQLIGNPDLGFIDKQYRL